MNRRVPAGLCLFALALAGCGLKGPLYLPEKSEVTTRPGPGSTTQEPPAPTDAPPSPPPTPPDAAPGTDRA